MCARQFSMCVRPYSLNLDATTLTASGTITPLKFTDLNNTILIKGTSSAKFNLDEAKIKARN